MRFGAPAPLARKIVYALKTNVRACVDQGVVVFLDLRNDRYLSMEARRAPKISGVCEGTSQNAAGSLVACGLIEAPGVPPRGERAGSPAGSADPGCFRKCRVSLFDAVKMLQSCVRASFTVRGRRLDLAFLNFARRKRAGKPTNTDVAEVVGRFERMRPWYPRARVCLFDSLALMDFLLAFGHKPAFVMGVRATPFAAHCWVELEDTCLNDAAENCQSYTPIAWT